VSCWPGFFFPVRVLTRLFPAITCGFGFFGDHVRRCAILGGFACLAARMRC
jgi:hypothetical protein